MRIQKERLILALILPIFILDVTNGMILTDVEFFRFGFSALKRPARYWKILYYFDAKYNFLATIINGYWILPKGRETQFYNTNARVRYCISDTNKPVCLVEPDQMLLWPINKRCAHNVIFSGCEQCRIISIASNTPCFEQIYLLERWMRTLCLYII